MGKSSSVVTGYHYRPAFHQGLCLGPIDAFLEWRVADKTAWRGQLAASGVLTVAAPRLFGGPKDQGGVEGQLEVMFGELSQEPNAYLAATFGEAQPAWRGLATMVWQGGRYGANNPYANQNSSKVCKILRGWDDDAPWYPEKAEIPYAGEPSADIGVIGVVGGGAIEAVYHGNSTLENMPRSMLVRVQAPDPARDPINEPRRVIIRAEGSPVWDSGWIGDPSFQAAFNEALGTAGLSEYAGPIRGIESVSDVISIPGAGPVNLEATWLVYNAGPSENYQVTAVLQTLGPARAMNPAHMLVYSRIHSERGREPLANINEQSLQAAADRLHSEGLGLCTMYDPAEESPAEFEQRICRVIAASFERSIVDGQWYLELARQDYDAAALPVLTDEDILSYDEQPATLDRAVNSLSVRYFDPERKESMVTPAVRALGLVRRFGEIHETLDFPEIPTGSLALRIAERELRARVTPTRGFKLVTTPHTYAWRRGQRFRLQSDKRGIANMVCIIGEKERGGFKSGAIRLVATQDIYSLPATTYVEIEPGIEPPDPTPEVIDLQRSDEVPYFELASRLPRAELLVLPPEAGYVMANASDAAAGRDFTMMVAPSGGAFEEAGTGYWCPTATTVTAHAAEPGPTSVALAGAYQLDQVQVGTPVLWGDEISRVDAIDVSAATVTVSRGCADTVPAEHPPGSRLWFYDQRAVADPTEYSAGESVQVRLLSNTGTAELPLALATPMDVTFEQRAFRPYPPADVRVGGSHAPSAPISGDIVVSLAHRDRLLQADMLVPWNASSIGPEPGVEYEASYYDEVSGDLLYMPDRFLSDTATHAFPFLGRVRLELRAYRDDVPSWQAAVVRFDYDNDAGEFILTEDGEVMLAEDGQPIQTEG